MAFRRLAALRLWIDLETLFLHSTYPRKVGRMCISPFISYAMFRPLSYCHVPSNLGNWRLEQGRIGIIASSFGKSVSSNSCWDPSYEYLVVLSQFVPALRLG